MKTITVAALSAVLSIAVSSGSAAGATPGPVSLRIEGPASTLVPLTSVNTVAGTFTHDGNPAHICAYESAGGVLQLGTNGNWAGAYNTGFGDYFIDSINGVAAGANEYWSVWYNHAPAQTGACGQVVNPGDDVLFFIDCFGAGCPNGGNGYAVLEERAPAVAQVGTPVTIGVTTHDAATGAPSPAVGAQVNAGSLSAITDAAGNAVLSFSSPGSYTVRATAPASVRSEARTVCVHNGDDGTCGTTAPAPGPATATPAPAPTPAGGNMPAPGPLAPVLTGLIDHHHYGRGHGPRRLAGSVPTAGPIGEIDLRLTRVQGKTCSYFSGSAARFVSARCDGAPFGGSTTSGFFRVSKTSMFDYLLPAKLGHGHYVAQGETVEAGGKRDVSAPVSFNVR
ncbi:MAG: hypothetical protein NVSMB51_03450 [Solirubrobacteraceae bacterium]